MAALVWKRLQELSTTIADICTRSGAPGLSYGVLYDGQLLRTEHFGHSEVEANKPTNDDTRYYICSLTKAIAAAAMGILVDE
jgi:CubicO group peptidase (beta-lactamase class C family)